MDQFWAVFMHLYSLYRSYAGIHFVHDVIRARQQDDQGGAL